MTTFGLGRRIELYNRYALRSWPLARRLTWLACMGALVLLVFSRVHFLADIEMLRGSPIETDDAYAYIIKATQLFDVDTDSATAYKDLKTQLGMPALSEYDAWVKYNERHRLTAVFAPLHSVLLAGLQRLGGWSWENTYSLLGLLGAAFQSVAVITLLYTIFGLGTTAVASILLSTLLLPHHGLHFVVPSTLSIACGFISLALLLRNSHGAWLFLSCLAAVGFHPVGRIFSAIVFSLGLIQLYLFRDPNRLRLIAPLAALALALLVPQFFPDTMRFSRDPLQAGTTYWGNLYINIATAKDIALKTFANGFTVSAILAAFGLYNLPRIRRARYLTLISISGLFLLGSLFYVLPHFPGELFSRLWVLMAVMLLGLIAHGIKTCLAACSAAVLVSVRRNRLAVLRPQHLQLVLLVLAAALLQSALSRFAISASSNRDSVASFAKKRGDFTFDSKAIETVLANTSPQDIVLYPSEEPMHFGLMYGLANRRAVYLPFHQQAASTQPLPRPKAILSFNPLFRAPKFQVQSAFTGLHDTTSGEVRASQKGIALKQQEWIEFKSSELDFQPTALRVEPSPEGLSLITRVLSPLPNTFELRVIGRRGQAAVCESEVTCLIQGESLCLLPSECQTNISTLMIQTKRPLRVLGLSVDAAKQLTNWPWNVGIAVGLRDHSLTAFTNSVELSTNFLAQDGNWRVIADAGSLLALVREEKHS